MPLEKAIIRNLITNEEIPCQFRPEKYTISKTNTFDRKRSGIGKNMDPPQYVSGGGLSLTLDLIFDLYEKPPGARDVRAITAGIWRLLQVTERKKEPNTQKAEPPHVEFRWGKTWSFKAMVESVSQTFTLFDPDGTPVRSTMQVKFTQGLEDNVFPNQNPTSGGFNGYSVHTVTQGETIDWIAYAEYGSSNAWRHLAAMNELDDPTRLQPGQRLVLYPLED